MRRILLFLRAMSLGEKLQFAVIALILGFNFAMIDLNPKNRVMGVPLWQVTVPLIVAMIVLARLMLPLMLANPRRTQQFLHALGLIVFGVWIVGKGQRWGRTLLAYFGITAGLWFETAASFWFVSEMMRRQELILSELAARLADGTPADEFDQDEQERFDEES